MPYNTVNIENKFLKIYFSTNGGKQMKCVRHDDSDAVGQCVQCGAGICADCAELTNGFSKREMMCVNCVTEEYREEIAYRKKENSWLLIKSIISVVFYAVGVGLLIASALGEWDTNHVMLMLLGVLLCGLFTGIAELKRTNRDIEKHEAKYGAEYVVDEYGVHKNNKIYLKIVGFVMGVFLGVVVTPITIIRSFIQIKKNKTDVKDMYEDIEKLQSI